MFYLMWILRLPLNIDKTSVQSFGFQESQAEGEGGGQAVVQVQGREDTAEGYSEESEDIHSWRTSA